MAKNKESNLPTFIEFLESSRFFKRLARTLLLTLIFVILLALLGGIIKTFLDLRLLFEAELEEALRKFIVDVVLVLAVVEIYKTTYTYFSEGRVRVTYIVDTVLVVMLAEVVSTWFTHDRLENLVVLMAVLFALIFIRILAIRFHPKDRIG